VLCGTTIGLSRTVDAGSPFNARLDITTGSPGLTCRSLVTRRGVFGLYGGESTSSFESRLIIETRSWDKVASPGRASCSSEVDRQFPLGVGNSSLSQTLAGKRYDVVLWPLELTCL
jgi:hypothetical protein